jgi:hypothetical protein
MKSLIRATAIITICIFLQSCSFISDIVLVNKSDTAIEIEYEASLKSALSPIENPPLPDSFVPKTMSVEKWESNYKWEDWTPLSPADYKVDIADGKFKLRLPPRTALRLTNINESIFYNDSRKEEFPLKKIQIKGLYGSMSFEGVQVFQQFVEKKDSKRYISYK